MPKYYQHIDPSDEMFGNVTTLFYIDDDDPDMRVYVFDDGSKCNENYIGALNDATAFDAKKAFAEVSSPKNVWRFNKKEIVANKQFATGKDGLQYEIPDLYMYDHNTDKKVTFDTYAPVMSNANTEPLDGYVLSNITSGLCASPSVDVERVRISSGRATSPKKQKPQLPASEAPERHEPVAEVQPYAEADDDTIYLDENGVMNIDIDAINANPDRIVNVRMNGRVVPMMLHDFMRSAMTPVEEKVVEKVVTREVEVNVGELEIEGKDGAEYGLVNNMIDMSKKEECSIAMELDVQLPPKSVYDIIKSAYTEGMTECFIRIIANNMSVRGLRMAVADGLSGYYDPVEGSGQDSL